MDSSRLFAELALNACFAVTWVLALVGFARRPSWSAALLMGAKLAAAAFFLAVVGAFLGHIFWSARIVADLLFIQTPLLLIGVGIAAWRVSKGLSATALIVAVTIVTVGVDAFLVEPTALELTETTIVSSKISRPLKILVLADIQTDNIGDYERRALRLAKEQDVDLILFAGDYLQTSDPELYGRLGRDFQALLQQTQLSAPLGIFAIRGNTEWEGWPDHFEGLGIRCFEETGTVDLGEFVLSCLSMSDSFNPRSPQPGSVDENRFHLVLGHSPNCALSDWKADLIVCGHTHGGQVRMPLVGPLLTMSRIPRSWAAGLTEMEPGRWLFVSRGIGHERDAAPRLRFLCRPEMSLIKLVPGHASDDATPRVPGSRQD